MKIYFAGGLGNKWTESRLIAGGARQRLVSFAEQRMMDGALAQWRGESPLRLESRAGHGRPKKRNWKRVPKKGETK